MFAADTVHGAVLPMLHKVGPGKDGFDTYRVYLTPNTAKGVKNVYAIFGDAYSPLVIESSANFFQVAVGETAILLHPLSLS